MIQTPSDCQSAIAPLPVTLSTVTPSRGAALGSRWVTLTCLWLVAVLSFGYWITAYGFEVDDSNLAHSASTWPSDSSLPFASDRSTLLLFLHPQCPCSRATLVELEKILESTTALTNAPPRTLVVASVPRNAGNRWTDSPLNKRAGQLPNADLYVDVDGIETDRFGVTTSGTVMLFAPQGKRTFSGGITISRGHEGRSVGGELLQERLCRDLDNQTDTYADFDVSSPPVFGCALCTPKSASETDGTAARCGEAEQW